MIIRIDVFLPAPLGPMTSQTAARHYQIRCCTAIKSGRTFVTPFRETVASMSFG
jgi:hypothetical protein